MPTPIPKNHYWPNILSIIFYLVLLTTQTTDADLFDSQIISDNVLTVTTVDFSANHTATSRLQASLFNINGLVPRGYQLSSLKLTNLGQQDLSVNLSTKTIANQQDLCPYLYLKIFDLNFNALYNGSLSQARSHLSLPKDSSTDLIFMLGSNLESNDTNINTCDFDIIFDSRLDQSIVTGLFDQEILQNHVQTSFY